MSLLATGLIVTGVILALIALIQAVAARGWLPESTLLALVGLLVGASYATLTRIAPEMAPGFDIIMKPKLPAEAYLWLFLPPLLFQAALTTNVRGMLPDAAPILLLAVVAVFVATGLIGWSLSAVSGRALTVCLLLGATVATTDPSAVIAIFRDLGAPARLMRLVEGESLLNDAAAIAIVGALMATLGSAAAKGGADLSWLSTLKLLAFGFGGGLTVGLLVGRLIVGLLSWLDRMPLAAASLTLAVPYPLYMATDQILDASGVVAVVAAGLVIGAYAPTRLTPRNWRHLVLIWEQVAVLAGAVVFLLAAAKTPELLAGMERQDFGYLAVVVLAALAARAVVMFGMFPLLSFARLAEPVDNRYKLAIVWGGLRGAVTLVLALALAHNHALSLEERRFLGGLAAAFVLVSLFLNGLTLRWVVNGLGLTALTPQQQAMQRQAIMLSTAEVETAIKEIGEDFQLPEKIIAEVQAEYLSGMTESADSYDIETAIPERDRLAIGLVTLATRENALIPEYGGGVISARNLDAMIRNTSLMIDAAREEGRLGYMRAARGLLEPTLNYRIGRFLALRFNWRKALARPLADRFELMICRRAVLERLIEYNDKTLRRLVGGRMSEALQGVLTARLAAVDEVLAELRKEFPGHTRILERRLLALFSLGKGAKLLEAMKAESLVSAEVALKLEKDLDKARRAHLPRPAPQELT